jgi:RNA polymerase sigma factor (sigma-70 family)
MGTTAGLVAAYQEEPLTDEEACALVAQAQAGDDEARNTVMLRNVRLASYMAHSFRLPHGIDRSDLFQEAELALVHAIRRYDPSRGVPFRAWASTTIRFFLWKRLRKQREYNDQRPYMDSRSDYFYILGDPPERVAREELRVLCEAALKRSLIEEKHAAVILLRSEGLSDKQVCARLGIHRNSIYRRVNHAIAAFQELIRVD